MTLSEIRALAERSRESDSLVVQDLARALLAILPVYDCAREIHDDLSSTEVEHMTKSIRMTWEAVRAAREKLEQL